MNVQRGKRIYVCIMTQKKFIQGMQGIGCFLHCAMLIKARLGSFEVLEGTLL